MKKKPIKCNDCKVKIGELVPNTDNHFYRAEFNDKAHFPIKNKYYCNKCGAEAKQ
jgi:hypothetical protein